MEKAFEREIPRLLGPEDPVANSRLLGSAPEFRAIPGRYPTLSRIFFFWGGEISDLRSCREFPGCGSAGIHPDGIPLFPTPPFHHHPQHSKGIYPGIKGFFFFFLFFPPFPKPDFAPLERPQFQRASGISELRLLRNPPESARSCPALPGGAPGFSSPGFSTWISPGSSGIAFPGDPKKKKI